MDSGWTRPTCEPDVKRVQENVPGILTFTGFLFKASSSSRELKGKNWSKELSDGKVAASSRPPL